MEISKREFQGKPRQAGPRCALKELANIKEAFILKNCFQAS
jgi:hypothetical protein